MVILKATFSSKFLECFKALDFLMESILQNYFLKYRANITFYTELHQHNKRLS